MGKKKEGRKRGGGVSGIKGAAYLNIGPKIKEILPSGIDDSLPPYTRRGEFIAGGFFDLLLGGGFSSLLENTLLRHSCACSNCTATLVLGTRQDGCQKGSTDRRVLCQC